MPMPSVFVGRVACAWTWVSWCSLDIISSSSTDKSQSKLHMSLLGSAFERCYMDHCFCVKSGVLVGKMKVKAAIKLILGLLATENHVIVYRKYQLQLAVALYILGTSILKDMGICLFGSRHYRIFNSQQRNYMRVNLTSPTQLAPPFPKPP